jgi:hypothetical protein
VQCSQSSAERVDPRGGRLLVTDAARANDSHRPLSQHVDHPVGIPYRRRRQPGSVLEEAPNGFPAQVPSR